jgi:hypothetical protein
MLGLDALKVLAGAGYEINMSKNQFANANLWLKYTQQDDNGTRPTNLTGQLSPHLSTT